LNRAAPPSVVLRTQARDTFIPLAVAFAEKAALGLGLNKDEALRLTLAAEEVFSYLSRTVAPDHTVEIACGSGGYFVSIEFTLPSESFQLRGFNLTTPCSLQDEAGLDEIGLVLAARLVDRFTMSCADGHDLTLTLIIEKTYPAMELDTSLTVQPVASFSIRTPSSEELKLVVHLMGRYYQGEVLPDFCHYPGKVVDMMTSGQLHTAVAVGPTGAIAGATLWRRLREKTVECFGPYVFGQPPGTGIREELLHACIHALARTDTVVLLNLHATKDFPEAQIELLGALPFYGADGSLTQNQVWFRLLREDPGCTVWSHPDTHQFLQGEYRRLSLPREIQPVRSEGEQQSPYSVLSTDFDRLQGQVQLFPAWPGRDMNDNVGRHIQLLRHEGLRNLFFFLDLSQSWQAAFAAALLPNGFVPCLVLPYAGEGDLLVFRYEVPGA
jgi:hypothetical protein